MKNKILITGVAGFIGFHLAKKLLEKKLSVIGLDNLNNYYSKKIKVDRLKILKSKKFVFYKLDLKNRSQLKKFFIKNKPDYVFHLAAQAGVRYSLLKPQNYIENNVNAFQNILEFSKKFGVKLFLFASSSSVYGKNKDKFLKVSSDTNMPISPYAVTKKTNEMMAYAYSHLYKFPTIGFRFFTVYGPWGRPDMSLYKFTSNIINNKKIQIFNNGNHERDFTYIDDAIDVLLKSLNKFSNKKKLNLFFKNKIPSKIFNISGNKTTTLLDYVNLIAKELKKKPKIEFKKLQLGDVVRTSADITSTKKILGFNPKTNLSKGISAFIKWYKHYNKIN